MDWIVRATDDIALREGLIAGSQVHLVEPLVAPYLGVAADGPGIAILMPDLTGELIAWERAGHDPVVALHALDRVLDAVARLHAMPWADYRATTPDWAWPWCPVRERLLLLSRPSAERIPGGRARRRGTVHRRLGCVRPAGAPGGPDARRGPVGGPGAAPRRAGPAPADGPPRRPEARQRRAARRRPGRPHRLGDDVARAGRGRAWLAARLQLVEPAGRAGGGHGALPGGRRPRSGRIADARRLMAGRPAVGPQMERDPARHGTCRRAAWRRPSATGTRRSTWPGSSGSCCAAGARASMRSGRPGFGRGRHRRPRLVVRTGGRGGRRRL